MSKSSFFSMLVAGMFLLASCSKPTAETTTTAVSADSSASAENAPKLRHVVMFKFKDGTTPEQTAEIVKAISNLKNEMPELIKDFEWGTNNSPENLNQGLTHCFFITFASEKDRDAYLPHPKHQDFVNKYAKIYVDKVTVLDYWVK